MRIALVANSTVSAQSMGGGDKILIELAKSWQKSGAELVLFGSPEAKAVCQAGGLETPFVETSRFHVKTLGTARTYLGRIIKAVLARTKFGAFDVIYSASESLPDVVLSAKIRRQNHKAVWVVGFYLRAPNPFLREVSFNFGNFLQLVQQKVSLWAMKYLKTTAVFVLGKDDQTYLGSWGFKKIFRIGGGVDLGLVDSVPEQEKIYDACFVGRISKQKGVDDLLKIWQGVAKQKPEARLAFIGWGHPGQSEIFIQEIKNKDLEKNIEFLGFRDGEEKYKVIKSSRLLLFPSKYESFGIVVLESLAAGVPVVAYNLAVLRQNFAEAVSFVPRGQTEEFSQRIIQVLNGDLSLSQAIERGRVLASRFDWNKLGSDTFNYINNLGQSL